jgi:hypothetical protein
MPENGWMNIRAFYNSPWKRKSRESKTIIPPGDPPGLHPFFSPCGGQEGGEELQVIKEVCCICQLPSLLPPV